MVSVIGILYNKVGISNLFIFLYELNNFWESQRFYKKVTGNNKPVKT